MISAALFLRGDNRLCVHVRRTGWFVARAAFSPDSIQASDNAYEQGEELRKALPEGFLRLIDKRGAGRALMLHIAAPGLNNFLWEYVPVGSTGDIFSTWQALPLIRAVPDTAYRKKQSKNQKKDFGFFSDRSLAPRHVFPNVDNEAARAEDPKPCDTEDGEPSRWANILKGFLETADFLHIVTHGLPGMFMKNERQGAYFKPEDIGKPAGMPRIVLAECCHSAETRGGDIAWEETMPGRFLLEGEAIYAGNMGVVDVPQGGTVFSACFMSECLETSYKDFALAVREARKRTLLSSQYDPSCVHIVYAAANLDPERNSCADILNAPVLKESGYRPPSCPKEPLPLRFRWPVYALGLIAMAQAALYVLQTSLYLIPPDSPAMMMLAAAATAVFAIGIGGWLCFRRRKKNARVNKS